MESRLLARLTAYTPGEQPRDKKYIKLNTNENPYPPCPKIQKKKINAEDFRLYPDPDCRVLKEALADTLRVPPSHIFTGNGSDEVLSFAFAAFFDADNGPVLFPEVTYSFYPVYCRFYGLPFRETAVGNDLSIDFSAFTESKADAGVIFPNPNAPTGIAVGRETIRRVLEERPKDRIFIIDEAYIDFGGESAVELTLEFENLLITGTFSKSRSLAGLRLGYAVANPRLIRALEKVKNSFNSYTVSRFTQECAVDALRDIGYFEKRRAEVIRTRERTAEALRSRGWDVLPSLANFLFAAHPTLPGETVYRRLKDEGILVRHFDLPKIRNRVRISVGTPEEMKIFLRTVDGWSGDVPQLR